jgi:hypothetical protein
MINLSTRSIEGACYGPNNVPDKPSSSSRSSQRPEVERLALSCRMAAASGTTAPVEVRPAVAPDNWTSNRQPCAG